MVPGLIVLGLMESSGVVRKLAAESSLARKRSGFEKNGNCLDISEHF